MLIPHYLVVPKNSVTKILKQNPNINPYEDDEGEEQGFWDQPNIDLSPLTPIYDDHYLSEMMDSLADPFNLNKKKFICWQFAEKTQPLTEKIFIAAPWSIMSYTNEKNQIVANVIYDNNGKSIAFIDFINRKWFPLKPNSFDNFFDYSSDLKKCPRLFRAIRGDFYKQLLNNEEYESITVRGYLERTLEKIIQGLRFARNILILLTSDRRSNLIAAGLTMNVSTNTQATNTYTQESFQQFWRQENSLQESNSQTILDSESTRKRKTYDTYDSSDDETTWKGKQAMDPEEEEDWEKTKKMKLESLDNPTQTRSVKIW